MNYGSIHPMLKHLDRHQQTFQLLQTGTQSAVLLFIRLAFGWKMFLSGYRHLEHVDDMVARFINWGITFQPRLNVYFSATTEMVGGLLLMIGLATRVAAIPLTGNFIVAIATAGRKSVIQAIFGGQVLSSDDYSAGRFGGLEAVIDDTAFPFLIASLVALAFGPGLVSADWLLRRFVFRAPASPPPAA